MRVIHKKIWPKWFKLVKSGKQNVQVRLADFRLRSGDTFSFDEWNPKRKKYTGRSIRKRVKRVTKQNPFNFYKYPAIKKYGFYLIEF